MISLSIALTIICVIGLLFLFAWIMLYIVFEWMDRNEVSIVDADPTVDIWSDDVSGW